MSGWYLLGLWSFDWDEVLGLGLLVALYLALCRLCPPRRGWYFAAGVFVLALSVLSPIGTLDDYLFSVHMLQHIGIGLVAPPLILLGLPERRVRPLLSWRPLGPLRWLLRRPMFTWLTGVLVMWLWHLPVLYDAAVLHAFVHFVEHLCFFVTGLAFFWPLVSPLPEMRVTPVPAMVYLFAAAMADGLLGILITFASPGFYPVYLRPNDPYGILPLLRERLHISAALDQQVGGLVMWVIGGGVLLGGLLFVAVRWLGGRDDEAAPAARATPAGGEV